MTPEAQRGVLLRAMEMTLDFALAHPETVVWMKVHEGYLTFNLSDQHDEWMATMLAAMPAEPVEMVDTEEWW